MTYILAIFSLLRKPANNHTEAQHTGAYQQ